MEGRPRGAREIVTSSLSNVVLARRPIVERVLGSPYQPGDLVRVIAAVDVEIHDVSHYVGRFGLVKYLEYECGSGQQYPDDPMIGVRFRDGSVEEFWREELCRAGTAGGRS